MKKRIMIFILPIITEKFINKLYFLIYTLKNIKAENIQMENIEIESIENIFKASKEIKDHDLQSIYFKFMVRRFHTIKNFTHMSYALEWVDRFKSGTPDRHMDMLSKTVWENIIKEMDQSDR